MILAVRTIRGDTMQLLAVTALAVVLVALAGIQGTQATRAPEVARIDLMQYHHDNSPYATPNLSQRDRIKIAVETSRERAEWLNWKISKNRYSSPYASKASVPVNSNQGNYLMRISVGSPPQTRFPILDTSFDLFWLRCDCSSCERNPSAYNLSASSTFAQVRCTDTLCAGLPFPSCSTDLQCYYEYALVGGLGVAGTLSSDVVSLGSLSSTVNFGCDDGSYPYTDGHFGLTRDPISVISQMGITCFSYCLTSFYSSTSNTSSLVLGDSGGSYSYTPLVLNLQMSTVLYYVNLNGILVNGTPLLIPPGTFSMDFSGYGGFIIDSGTTLTQLQMAAYTPLLSAVQSLITYHPVDGISSGSYVCYRAGSSPSWPSVTFQFEGVDVVLPGDNLFLKLDDHGNYCMAIQPSTDSSDVGVFGNVQQQNFNIQYDIGNNRIGFSEVTSC